MNKLEVSDIFHPINYVFEYLFHLSLFQCIFNCSYMVLRGSKSFLFLHIIDVYVYMYESFNVFVVHWEIY